MGRSFTPQGAAGTPFEGQELLSAFVCTPLQASVNDYFVNQRGFVNASLLQISSTAAVNLTGLRGATPNRELLVLNTGASAITVKNASGLSLAVNRFQLGADVVLNQNQAIKLVGLAAGGWAAQGGADGGSAPVAAVAVTVALTLVDQAIASGVSTAVSFDTSILDTAALWSIANPTRLIAPAAGNYLVTATGLWATTGANGEVLMRFRVNGAGLFYGVSSIPTSITGSTPGNSVAIILPLGAADYVEVMVFQNTGNPLNLLGVGAAEPSTTASMMAVH